jgi:hypothetical protein
LHRTHGELNQDDHYSSPFHTRVVRDLAHDRLCACAEQYKHYGVDTAEPVAIDIAITGNH